MRVLAALVMLTSLAFSGTTAAQEKWIEFSSPRYGFAVLFPKTPTESLDATTYNVLAAAGSSVYIVSVTDLSDALKADDTLISALVQAYSAAGQLTVRTQRRVTFANNAGVELIGDHRTRTFTTWRTSFRSANGCTRLFPAARKAMRPAPTPIAFAIPSDCSDE